MPEMSDHELLALISTAEQDSVIYNGEFSAVNERLLEDYLCEPYGDEVEDQSQAISSDVQDVVESDMPSLARIFLGSSQPVVFTSNTDSPKELAEVDEKNSYINWLIMDQPDSYQTLFSWLKDASIQKNGVVKYFMEEVEESKERQYANVDEFELDAIMQSLNGENVRSVDIASRTESNKDGRFDISFKVEMMVKKLCIINVPTEQFLISKSASTLDNAELVGDRVTKTRGTLLAEGFDRDLINSLPSSSTNTDSRIGVVRNKDTGTDLEADNSINNWASEEVEIRDLYVRIDFDGDGIAERRHIMKSGNQIIINEPFDHVPYASLSGVIMPHKVIGRSRGELTQQTQRVKTVMMRQALDNMYMVNHPRNVVHPDVNIDDMLHVRPNGLVRLKKNPSTLPQGAVFPLVTPYTGDKTLQMIQYMDQQRAQSTGTLQASQGLDADAIAKETATRFAGNREDAQAKIELVARGMAETGFRKLYEGVAWVVTQFQDTATEIRVLGKQLSINPSGWKHNNRIVSKVGLGNGQQQVANAQGLYGIQQQLQAVGSPLVDQVKVYNSLSEVVKGLGFKKVDEFFNNPEQPEELLRAENEILKRQVEQLTQQSQDNPLAEAEKVRAEALLLTAQGKAGIEAAKIQENARQFDDSLDFDKSKQNQDIAFDLTKLEVDSNKDIPGSAI